MGRALMTCGAVMVALATATALLSGCAPAAPPAAEPPPTSSQPIFASDEEALAAAEAAYAEYQRVSDEIAVAGGVQPDRIAAVVSNTWLPEELAGFKQLRDAGLMQLGDSSFDTISLQAASEIDEGALVVLYLCSDSSDTRIVNNLGIDVTPMDRVERYPLEVAFRSSEVDPQTLQLDEISTWSGESFC
ncbi:MAG: hypothetical protein ACSLE3_00735 [Microbacteriaceae bacterium]